MFLRSILGKPLAAVAALAAFAVMTDAAAVEWKYSSWTQPSAPNNRYGTVPLFEELQKQTNGEFTFKNFMGAQLFNAFTTLKGVRDGAVDAGVTVPVFNAAELSAHVTIASLQALTRDGYSTAGAGTETLLLNCAECLADYDKNNTVTLGVYSGAPYHLMCNFEVSSMDDLKGKKLVEGSPVFARWAAELGMTRIQMGIGDYLQAMQRGTADCTTGPLEWLYALSLKDVVKTVVENQTLGVFPAVSIMTVNKNSWHKLPANLKKTLIRNMPDTIARTVDGYYKGEERGRKEATEKGAKFVSLGSAYEKKWEAFQASEPGTVAAGSKKLGVQDPQAIIDATIGNLKTWETIVDKEGHTPETVSKHLWDRVFSKLDL